ncbi:MAG: hypothetical protein GTO60_01955, partial [Gammaproteobacteria bacterium]|nr:hypothetical protein [Gammaproteobacteria bacterium]
MNKTLISLLAVVLVSSTAVRADIQLIQATKAGDTASISKLIRDKVNINQQAPDGTTAMHWAIHRDEPEIVTLLIEADANLNIAD